jgi:hypothetical protein
VFSDSFELKLNWIKFDNALKDNRIARREKSTNFFFITSQKTMKIRLARRINGNANPKNAGNV